MIFQMTRTRELPASKEIPSWAQALRSRRDVLKLTQDEVAAASGDVVSQKTISNFEKGKHSLSKAEYKTLLALARGLKWSLDDLQKATGVAFEIEQPPPLIYEPSAFKVPSKVLEVRSLAAAGIPDSPIENHLGHYIMPLSNYRNGLEIYIADGESMARNDVDGIQNGDVLLVDEYDKTPRDGEVFVIQDQQTYGLCVKRTHKLNNEWFLFSDNKKYPPFKLDEAVVIGRVVDAEGKRKFK